MMLRGMLLGITAGLFLISSPDSVAQDAAPVPPPHQCFCPPDSVIDFASAVMFFTEWDIEKPPANSNGKLLARAAHILFTATGVKIVLRYGFAITFAAGPNIGGSVSFGCPEAVLSFEPESPCESKQYHKNLPSCDMSAKDIATILQTAGALDGSAYDTGFKFTVTFNCTATGLTLDCEEIEDQDGRDVTKTITIKRNESDSEFFNYRRRGAP